MLRKALRLFGATLLALPALLVATKLYANDAVSMLNMPQGVSTISQEVYNLHMLIFWICVIIGVIVFAVMLWAMVFHRNVRGRQAENWHEHLGVELAWTIIPFVILVAMAFPATRVLIDLYDTSEAEIDVFVTGYQWRWHYNYLNEEVQFLSELSTPLDQVYNLDPKNEFYKQEVNNPLVVPVNTKVRILLTSQDVIHSWWMPDFAVKKDAIPGYITETWFEVTKTGVYRGECTELCGQGHAFMPIVVSVVEREEYDQWIVAQREQAEIIRAMTEQTFTMEDLMARGQDVYMRTCAACHQPNGQGIPPAFPTLVGSAISTGPVEGQLNVLVNGVEGTVMQAFGAMLSEVDLAAVITYTRNAFGNNVGDVVQPIDVYNFKQGQ